MGKRQPTARPEQQPTPLRSAYDAFILSRQAQNVTARTLTSYTERLSKFLEWCTTNQVSTVNQITGATVRTYVVYQRGRGLSPWTVHGHARCIKTFLRFCVDDELIPQAPKFTMPKLPDEYLPAFETDEVQRLLDACTVTRDRLVVLVLLDTGLRASEFVALDAGDINGQTGAVTVRQGKGQKDRTVYLGARTRRELTRYLRMEHGPSGDAAVWVNMQTGDRLTHSGLRQLLRRLGKRADVDHCHPHTFRRTFALWSLRAGMSLVHLQRLMGHADLTVLRRYLALLDDDIHAAHQAAGPVDHLLRK